MSNTERIKLQIKNWPRSVEGDDIEITNMIADIVNREMWKVNRNIARQLLEGDPERAVSTLAGLRSPEGDKVFGWTGGQER